MTEEEKWKKRLERERTARREAEHLLEQKSSQLYDANIQLGKANELLSNQVKVEANKFRELFNSSIDGIVLYDNSGSIILANKAFCDMAQISFEEVIHKNLRRFIGLDRNSRKELRSAILQIDKTGAARFVCSLISTKRTKIACEISANRFEVENQSINQAIIRDITQRQKVATALKQASEKAIEANKAKSMFLATMSHEIRTPLNAIIGFTDILLQENLKDEHNEHLNLIKKSGDILLNVINDVLDFSKIESRKVEIENIDFNFHDSIREVVEIHAQTAQQKGISLKHQIDSDVPLDIHGDKGRLQQILINLISNAIKFTQDGSVLISAKNASSNFIEISVKDSGIGFDPALSEKLFTPFQQEDASTTRKFGGTGLGLAICKELIEMLGGTIKAESTPGKGATFTIMHPRTPATTIVRSEEKPLKSASKPQSKKTDAQALLVEDNPINAKLAKIMIERMGLKVSIAHNGQEALDALQTHSHFDIIFMDMQMPVMDGVEATINIRAAKSTPEEYKDIQIIAMTANASNEDEARCLDAGMNFFIPKPINQKQLKNVLTSLNLAE